MLLSVIRCDIFDISNLAKFESALPFHPSIQILAYSAWTRTRPAVHWMWCWSQKTFRHVLKRLYQNFVSVRPQFVIYAHLLATRKKCSLHCCLSTMWRPPKCNIKGAILKHFEKSRKWCYLMFPVQIVDAWATKLFGRGRPLSLPLKATVQWLLS